MNTSNGNPADHAEESKTSTPGHSQYYAAFVSLAIHGQENKWWMLYVYLLFSSVLVLACVGLFVSTGYGRSHQLILSLLCLAGLVVSVSWIAMTVDYVDASNLFGDIAKEAEAEIPAQLGRPFTRRSEQRSRKPLIGTLKFVALAIPAILGLTYAMLLVLAWWKPPA